MKRFVFAFFVFCSSLAFGQKAKVVQEILTLSRTQEKVKAAAGSIIQNMQKQRPQVSAQKWQKISAAINYTSFMNKMASIYETNYTLEELNQMVTLLKKGDASGFQLMAKRIEGPSYSVGKEFGKSIQALIEKETSKP